MVVKRSLQSDQERLLESWLPVWLKTPSIEVRTSDIEREEWLDLEDLGSFCGAEPATLALRWKLEDFVAILDRTEGPEGCGGISFYSCFWIAARREEGSLGWLDWIESEKENE